MDEKRMQAIAEYLHSNPERAKKLTELDVEEACVAINNDGFDFTVDELSQFAKACAMAEKNADNGDELSEDSLDNVSGGLGAAFWIGVGVGIGVAVWYWKQNHPYR